MFQHRFPVVHLLVLWDIAAVWHWGWRMCVCRRSELHCGEDPCDFWGLQQVAEPALGGPVFQNPCLGARVLKDKEAKWSTTLSKLDSEWWALEQAFGVASKLTTWDTCIPYQHIWIESHSFSAFNLAPGWPRFGVLGIWGVNQRAGVHFVFASGALN